MSGPGASAGAAEPAGQRETTVAAPPVLDDVVAAPPTRRSGPARWGGRWPGRTITYSETLPASYDWALSRALRAWNRYSGARVDFVKARRGSRGQLRISRGSTPGVAGMATLGYTRNAWAKISNGYPRQLPRRDWISAGVVLTHELGHVLGLDHGRSNAGCEVMDAYLECDYLSARPGYMDCRWVKRNDAERAVRLYGGRVALGPRTCAIEPAPPQLLDVVVSGGMAAGSPVRLDWRRPPGLPPGSRITVVVSVKGRCGATQVPYWQDAAVLGSGATSWVDADGADRPPAEYCYQLAVENYWGRPAGPWRFTRANYVASPVPPVVHERSATDVDDEYLYRVDLDQDASLRYLVGAQGACRQAYDDGSAELAWQDADTPGWFHVTGVPHGSCVTFFAVGGPWGQPSTPVSDLVP